MKKLSTLLLFCLTVTLNDGRCADPEKLMPVKDPRDPNGCIVTICAVSDFGAMADGQTDDTPAFEKAIAYADSKGGGSVYVPAGKYVIRGRLSLPNSVYLVGDWTNPESAAEKVPSGSVLLIYGGRGEPSGGAAVTVGGSAGLIGLTFFYPEQSVEAPVPYPATVRLFDTSARKTYAYATMQCVTLVNSYFGVEVGAESNALHYISHLYGTAINIGVRVNQCWDVGRFETVVLSPKIWASYAGISETAVRDLLRSKLSAIVLQKASWQYVYDLRITDCKIGLVMEKDPTVTSGISGTNGQMDTVRISGAFTGVHGRFGRATMALSNVRIEVIGGEGAACVRLEKDYQATLQVTSASFSNPTGSCLAVEENSGAIVTIQESEFTSSAEAIRLKGGSISVLHNRFVTQGPAIEIAATARAATIVENQFDTQSENPVVLEKIGAAVFVDPDRSYVWTRPEIKSWNFAAPYQPASAAIISVSVHGAIADGKTDCTAAFQRTLDTAKELGGGIAYVPGGRYLLSGTLRVPTGVELRGVSEAPHHTSGLGAVLLTTTGEGNAEAEPFISLEAGAGVRGLTLWYPLQNDIKNVKPYPWAIRVLGQDAGIRFVSLGNTYRGIDMASADCGGHYVDSVTGLTLSRGLVLDKSTKRGEVRNVHFNPHFWASTRETNLPASTSFVDAESLRPALFDYQDANNIPFIVGETKDEFWFNVFNYRSHIGMIMTGGFDGTFHGLGLDGTVVSLSIEGNQPHPLRFTNANFDIVPGTTRLGEGNLFIATENAADIAFSNSNFSSFNFVADNGATISGANVTFRQSCFAVTPRNGAIRAKTGEVKALGCSFFHQGPLTKERVFTQQPGTVVDIIGEKAASVTAVGNIGVNSFNAEIATGSEVGNVAAKP